MVLRTAVWVFAKTDNPESIRGRPLAADNSYAALRAATALPPAYLLSLVTQFEG